MHDVRRLIRQVLFGAPLAYYWSAHAAAPAAPRAAPPASQLPAPCTAGICGSNSSFITSGSASALFAGKNLSINQSTNSATLNWASFNIGADGKVTFVQPSSSAVALNRIYDGNPSQIFGSLSANGQIYLINANGFLFGPTATVNVAGLIASSLNITDKTFTNGLLSPIANQAPALEPFTGSDQHFSDDGPLGAKQVPNTGSIDVAPGAQLTATGGGRLLLAAGNVDNAGSLTAPNGQVILAGGQSVFLQASTDNALRGLIVQVDAGSSAGKLLSSVVNESTGQISTPLGNVTLAGLMINQNGRISATTSVAANGSVILSAGTAPAASSTPIVENQGGQITLGPQSDIEILPELNDTATAVALQTQLPSTVTITGQKITMQGGAAIRAPGGVLNVAATSDPASGVTAGYDPTASLRIDAGTTIDLSGSSATLPMDANLIQVQLRSNEFADDPTQRNGALRGSTVTVDIRADGGKGSPIADLASAIAAVGQTIAQRTETGGTATFKSAGDIVFSPGASIDVSGGATTYLGGNVQTSKLVGANGQLYDIGSANPLLTYSGLINPTYTQTYNRWGVKEIVPTPGLSTYEPTYEQGAAAGSIQFVAPSLVLQGSLKGTATSGPYQRSASSAGLLGGKLIIGEPGNVAGTVFDYLAPPIEIVATPTPIVVSDGSPLPVQILQLPASYLTSDGFDHFQFATNTTFHLPAGLPLQLAPGTTLAVQASRIDIDSSITALGGALSFQSVDTIDESNFAAIGSDPRALRLGIGVGDDVTLDVSGQWTNDTVAMGGVGSAPILQNGGSINLQLTANPTGNTTPSESELVLGNGVALRANGGAWQQNSGAVSYGTGGSITLDASPAPGGAVQFGAGTQVQAFGVGTAQGGSLAIDAPRIDLSAGTGTAWTEAQRVDDLTAPGGTLKLFAPLLADYGFSNISLTATGPAASRQATDTLAVEASASPYLLQAQNLLLDSSALSRATGGSVEGFAQPVVLPAYQRPVANLSLNSLRLFDDQGLNTANYGSLDVKAGASIVADTGASISMNGAGDIYVGGSITAPSGSVSLKLLAPSDFGFAGGLELDPGYIAGLGITLGAQSRIDVSADGALYTPNNQSLLLGGVRNGGAVSINADRGSVNVAAGAQIAFSGTNGLLDVRDPTTGAYTREDVATAGGSLTIGAVDSLQLLGSVRGAGGVGSTGAAAGGSLEIDLATPLGGSVPGQPLPATQPRVLNLVADASGLAPPGSEQATIGIAQILNGTGIDALTLNSGGTGPGEILLSTGIPLTLARSLVLDSQLITVAPGVAASAAAPYVVVGNPITQGTQPAPIIGSGSLSVAANQLTLLGNVTLDGTGQVTLASQGDIQLQGTHPTQGSGSEQGSLSVAGDLTLTAQRIYPDTFTSFAIQAQGASTTSSVQLDPALVGGRPVTSSVAPLSAAGSLSVSADRIEVGGSLFAPFGQINLSANQSLMLSSGSLVSVSGAGLEVPFGQTQADGAQWVYIDPLASANGLSATVSVVAAAGVATPITGTPTKNVSLTAPNLTMQPHSTVNLNGGGDLYAYEWVPGTGGTVDRLAGSGDPGNTPGLYAILPSQAGLAAPHDPQETGNYGASQTVYLSGGAGIAAGYYALLPPRYGLVPGARLIQIEPAYVSPNGGQLGSLGDGTPVVGGYLSSAGTTLNAGSTVYEGFAVYPSGYGQQLAAYSINQDSSYFEAAAVQAGKGTVPLPADAGTLNFTVLAPTNAAIGTSLALLGNVETTAASGGQRAVVNLSAPDLEVSADGSASSVGASAVSSTVLQGWNAGQLTLGGALTPSTDVNGQPIYVASVASDHVTVDAGVSLSADQIVVLAHEGIEVKSGASLASTSGKNGSVLASVPPAETVTLSDTGAAFLAVSDLALPVVSRNGATGASSLALDAGSSLSSGGALALDAPGSLVTAGTLNGKGASWSLGSDSIGFIGASGAHPDTLNIDATLLQSLQAAGAVRLASQSSIDLYAPVTLGVASTTAAPTLGALTLVADSIDNLGGGSSMLGAASLTLGGATASGAATAPVAGSGTLSLIGNSLNFAANPLAISGFANTVLQVAGPVTSSPGILADTGPNKGVLRISVGGITAAGDLAINATDITPGGGAQTTLAATGTLSIGAPTRPAAAAAAPLVGGELDLQASAIDDAGVIAAPAGVVKLAATAGDLHLGTGSAIDVAGLLLPAVDHSAPAPGGTIALSATGNVALDAGSTLNVSGEQVAPAGRLGIVAGNAATLSGALVGLAGSGGTGGDFTLDAGQLSGGFTAMASKLMSGGFSNAVSVRVHQGDLALLAASDPNAQGLPLAGTLTANSISLTADSGTVDIAGVIGAPSAALRGHIDLSGNSVVLESSGALHADGSGAAGLGGEIEVNATCGGCAITLVPGSVISTAGSGGMGELILRAAALPSTNDVAINVPGTGIAGLGADLTQVGQLVIDAVTTYSAGNGVTGQNLADNLASVYVPAASTFLTAASPVITQRLVTPSSKLGATAPLVEAGVELVDANPADSITLSSIDLSGYSLNPAYGGMSQVINIGVRTAGTLTVNGTLSDGFIADPTFTTNNRPALSPTPSASFSLVAGADVVSADPLATLRGSTASLTLLSSATPADYSNGLDSAGGPSVVRTGTGDINLAAAGDILFGHGSGGVASVYTGGLTPTQSGNVLLPVPLANTNVLMNFGTGGGDVRLAAGGNVTGAPVGGNVPGAPASSFDPSSDGGNYGVTGWLFRQGNAQHPGQYGVDYGNFDWNVGALGGGDVTVSAGGSVTNVSAAVADSYVAAANSLNGQATAYGGGGGLAIHAGGNVASPQIYVASGTGVITADGGLTTNLIYPQMNQPPQPVGGAIALGDSQVSVWARTGLQIDAIYDPTLVPQLSKDTDFSSQSILSYAASSSVTLSTTAGDAILNENSSPLQTTLSVLVGSYAASSSFDIIPPTLTVQALQGDFAVGGGSPIKLTPASQGQLSLFAARDITFASNSSILMSDAPLASMPTIADPGLGLNLVPFLGVVHTGDPNPALITAGRDLVDLHLEIPKATQIVAGRDIRDLNFQGQNTSPTDVTLVAAGRDYLSTTAGQGVGVQLGGPGSVDLLTGRNLDFGSGGGIVTVGSLYNGDLPTAAGADINLMVGYGSQGADLSGFLTKIIDPSPAYQAQLVSYVESLNGASGETFTQASADFAGFNTQQQSALIDSVFFNELLLSGRAANSGSGVGFTQGYAAIDALFPNSREPTAGTASPYAGKLTLTSSQIYTDSGGNISILVPGGGIDVGLANAPPNAPKKDPSQLGIVAEGAGNVDIYALDDVNVNTSRIFTLGGGNILIWSTLGSIDAGNGSKSSLSVPPPTITINTQTGQVSLNFGASLAAGSGIRTIETSPAVPPGNVDLDAPVGTVNAGDAGIGASGNINIAAAHVIGVDNINFGGTATGVPADISSVGASLSGASAVAAGTTTSSTKSAQEGAAAKETAPIAQAALNWLDVFVLGLGEENCKQDDLECLKRQKAAAP